ncbi:hypothetical protein ABIA30_003500 [Mycobacterium sp. MAA66]
MATTVGDHTNVGRVSATSRTHRRFHAKRVGIGVAATVGLLFTAVLPLNAGEMAVASASVRPMDVPPPVPVPGPTPGSVAQNLATAGQALQSLPLPPNVQQDLAAALAGIPNPAGISDDAAPSDDDVDNSQAEEQQQAEQQQQDQWDQQQEQLNIDQQNDEQAELNSEQQAQEQNDAAQQQVDEGIQQAQQDEINANQ